MQNYVVAKPVHSGSEFVAFSGTRGEVELASVGNDGQVYYGVREQGATGWSARPLGPAGVSANAPVVALTADGLGDGRVIIVAALTDGTLFWALGSAEQPIWEQGNADQPALVPLDLAGAPKMPWAALQVKFYEDGSASLLILAGTGGGDPGIWLYQAANQSWIYQGDTPLSSMVSYTGDVAACRLQSEFWNYVDYYISYCNPTDTRPRVEFLRINSLGDSTLSLLKDTTNDNKVVYFQRIAVVVLQSYPSSPDVPKSLPFGATASGEIYRQDHDKSSDASGLRWKFIAETGGTVAQIVAFENAQRLAHLFVLMADGQVMVLQELSFGGEWTQPVPVTKGVTRIAGALRGDGSPIGFALTGTGKLVQWFQQEDTTDWLTQPVALEGLEENVAEVWSYSTELVPLDARGTRRPEAKVRLWASGITPIVVNGNGALLSPTESVDITADGFGLVNLVYVATDLGSPVLRVWHDGMPEGETVEMQMNHEMQNRLEALTGDRLLDLKLHDGSPLLTGDAATKETADSVAEAVNLCMSLARPPLPNDSSARVQDPPSQRSPSARASTAEPFFLHRIDPSRVSEQHWLLRVKGGTVTFQRLTRAQAIERMQTMATATASLGLPSWGDMKGFFRSTGTAVTEVFVSTILDASDQLVQEIYSQITFVVNGVKKIYQATVDLVEQAFDLAEIVFWTVGTKVSALLDALSFVFDWDDILRTQQGVSWAFSQTLLFIKSLTQDAAEGTLSQLGSLRGFLKSRLEAAEQSEFAGKTLQELLGLTPEGSVDLSKEIVDGGAHNIIFTGFVDHANGSTIPPLSPGGLSDAQLQSLAKANASTVLLCEKLRGSGIGAQALQLLQPCMDDPKKVLDLTIGDLLQLLTLALDATFDLVEGLVEAFFATIAAFIENIHEFLTAPWDIPLITPLYNFITKQPPGAESNLTVLDVFSLMLAVPSTPAAKLITGQAPFPDDDALAEFESAYTVDSLRAHAGLSSLSGAALEARVNQEIYQKSAVFCTTVRAAALFIGGVFNIYNDGKALLKQLEPMDQESFTLIGEGMSPDPSNLDTLTALGSALMGAVVWATQTPWLIYSNAGNFDTSTGSGKGNCMWVGRSFIVTSRIFLAIATSRTDTQVYRIGPWLASGLGFANLVLTGMECYQRDATITDWTSRCLPPFAEMMRFGLDDQVATGTELVSVVLVILLDTAVISYTGALTISVAYSIHNS